MNIADLGAVAALLSIPAGLITVWWNGRSVDRGTRATLLAGLTQADASVVAARVQGLGESDLWQQAALADASAAFLRSADAFIRIVRMLPELDHDQRASRLDKHGADVETAFSSLDLLASPDLRRSAEEVLSYCKSLERRALDRAVLRSAIKALEDGWCYGNPELCNHPHHDSAWVAWELLVDWPRKEEETREEDRGLLEYCLEESPCFSEQEARRVLALADRNPASWAHMLGGWIRDPLLERFTSLRTSFVDEARGARPVAVTSLGA
ncbi:hypothetical protein [Streptomyces sp. NPDC002671]